VTNAVVRFEHVVTQTKEQSSRNEKFKCG